MKRFILMLTVFMLVFTLCACSGEEETKVLDLQAEADAIIENYSLSGGQRYSSKSETLGEYLDEDLIRSYYGDAAEMPNFDEVEEYAVYIDESKPLNPCEFGIFKMKEGANTEEFMLFLKARINLKIDNAKAYPSMDTEPLKTAVFTEKGGYIWYIVVKGGNEDINKTLEGKL